MSPSENPSFWPLSYPCQVWIRGLASNGQVSPPQIDGCIKVTNKNDLTLDLPYLYIEPSYLGLITFSYKKI